jgi:hypothetical protein
MTLSLPADAEPFLPTDADLSHLSTAGVYALRLSRPADLAAAWDRTFEHRPEYFAPLRDAAAVVYVGAAQNVLGRLTDHADGDVRQAALLEVCTIDELRNIWWCEAERRFIVESQTATMLQHERPGWYIHQR